MSSVDASIVQAIGTLPGFATAVILYATTYVGTNSSAVIVRDPKETDFTVTLQLYAAVAPVADHYHRGRERHVKLQI